MNRTPPLIPLFQHLIKFSWNSSNLLRRVSHESRFNEKFAVSVFRRETKRSECLRLAHHLSTLCFSQRRRCYVRCELWPCAALGNTSDCLSQLLCWCCNPLDLARVWLSCEPLFSIFLFLDVGHVCACLSLCVCLELNWH